MPAPEGLLALTSARWETEVLQSRVPVVVGFWAEWCLPCHMAAPAWEEAARVLHERLRFGFVRYDDEPELVSRYAIKGLPTVLVTRRGEDVGRRVGLMGREALRAFLDRHL